MACRMKRFWCDCSLQTATKFIGCVDMVLIVLVFKFCHVDIILHNVFCKIH
jgi:hypothetical protein